jgi:hypothetical protein
MNSGVSPFSADFYGVLRFLMIFGSWTPSGLDAGKQFVLSLQEKKGKGSKTNTLR